MCFCLNLCASYACRSTQEARREYYITWISSYRQLWVTMQILGVEPRSSEKALCGLNHWTNSPALIILIFVFFFTHTLEMPKLPHQSKINQTLLLTEQEQYTLCFFSFPVFSISLLLITSFSHMEFMLIILLPLYLSFHLFNITFCQNGISGFQVSI